MLKESEAFNYAEQLWLSLIATLHAPHLMALIFVASATTILSALLLLLVSQPFMFFLRRRRNRNKGMMMTASERQQFIDKIISDGITDAIEDARFDGRITATEAADAYSRMAEAANLIDLVPQRLRLPFNLRAQQALSWVIRNRIRKLKAEPVHILPGAPVVVDRHPPAQVSTKTWWRNPKS